MDQLLKEIRDCVVCEKFLPFTPRPVLQASPNARILIIGQAPGQKVNVSGIPWNDKSGNELRRWLGLSEEQFYDRNLVALVPMGFCYPGKGVSGDLPPRSECAPLWHKKILSEMKQVELTLLIGHYAQKHYLGEQFNPSITENVKNFRDFLPRCVPLVHPSPRNNIWQKKNPWFESTVVPALREIVLKLIG